MMLSHIGQNDIAAKVQNAWLRTIEDGIHTGDLYKEGLSSKRVGTKEFCDAVIERLGQKPQKLAAVDYGTGGGALKVPPVRPRVHQKKELIGVDVFLDWEGAPDDLAAKVKAIEGTVLKLKIISNRGVKVWPNGAPETFCSDSFRLRYFGDKVTHADVAGWLATLAKSGFDYTSIENLYNFDGEAGFTKAQGE
jgi:isocitrate dehydrogenase